MPMMISVAARTARLSSRGAPKPWVIQSITIPVPITTPPNDHRAAEHQPVLQPVARAHPVEPAVLLAHEVGAVGVGADPERDDLRADDRQQCSRDQCMDVPLAAEHPEVGDHDQLDQGAEGRHRARRAG